MTPPAELQTVARRFGELLEEVVFVGGMIRELFITDRGARLARPTDDVDCIVNSASWAEYHTFAQQLRARGFSECADAGAPICRWVVEGVRVDVMPTDPAVLGFTNVWYPSGVTHAVRITSPQGDIRIVDAVHFCATKIEAFISRGGDDFYHHDMEDLIAVVDGRPELVNEITAAPNDVRAFITETIGGWLDNADFINALPGHLPGDRASQARYPILLTRLRTIASLTTSTAPTVTVAASRPASGRVPVGLVPSGSATAGQSVRVSLQSTNLAAAAYDAGSRVLTIEFHSGGIYRYSGVPQNVFGGLLVAASHGQYFAQWIKDRYPTHRVR